jgi:hypothetical protein
VWIIEGLGSIKAAEWGRLAQSRLSCPTRRSRFSLYHGPKATPLTSRVRGDAWLVLPNDETAARIVRTAEVTARLYAPDQSRREHRRLRSCQVRSRRSQSVACALSRPQLPIDEEPRFSRDSVLVAALVLQHVRGPIFVSSVRETRAISPHRPNLNRSLHKLIPGCGVHARRQPSDHVTFAIPAPDTGLSKLMPVSRMSNRPTAPARIEGSRSERVPAARPQRLQFHHQLNLGLRARRAI